MASKTTTRENRLAMAKRKERQQTFATGKRRRRIEERLDKLEEEAKRENAQFEEEFTDFKTFSEFLDSLPPEEKAKRMKEFRETASSIIDHFFDRNTRELKENLETRLDNFNQKQRFASDKEIATIKRQIRNMDRDVIDALSDNFESLADRNALTGGGLKKFADKVLRERTIAISDVREVEAFAIRGREEALGREEAGVARVRKRGIETIERARETGREEQAEELIEEESLTEFQRTGDIASKLLPSELVERLNKINAPPEPEIQTVDRDALIKQRKSAIGERKVGGVTAREARNRARLLTGKNARIGRTARDIMSNTTTK